ncbi:MAG: hypothetical protein J5545_04100 [Bacteroidaceae bacterium]|nr:hypothetical protein [Bacteroidaceae bacterium]
MNVLDTSFINLSAPYMVWKEDERRYCFETDQGGLFQITFDLEQSIWLDGAYELGIQNIKHVASPRDLKLKKTIIAVVEEFFRQNPGILLYICETGDGRQAQRSRLFLSWFKEYQDLYVIKSVRIQSEGIDNYASIIVQQNNPALQQIIADFESMVHDLTFQKPKEEWEWIEG